MNARVKSIEGRPSITTSIIVALDDLQRLDIICADREWSRAKVFRVLLRGFLSTYSPTQELDP